MPESVIGVDLGGTNVRAGIYDGSDALGSVCSSPSSARGGVDAVVESISDVVLQAQGDSKPLGIGLAVPGHIDDEAGLVRWAPNFGQDIGGRFEIWRDVPLKSLLEKRLGTPVVMGNDANLAALGEYRFGSGLGTAKCLVMLTLGTGVGGGVVLSPAAVQGRANGPLILVGANGGGAELGHVCISREGQGSDAVAKGALEMYCNAAAIVALAQAKMKQRGIEPPPDLSPKTLSVAAHAGDTLALEVWTEVGTHLGTAVGSFINIFAPDIVAIGGQISKVGEPLLAAVREEAQRVAIPTLFADASIVGAERVNDAGILGAAALASEAFS